jgi:hypothetical protein
MAAQEQAEGLALARQALRLGPIGDRAVRGGAQAEQVHLSHAHGARVLLAQMHGAIELGGERGAIRVRCGPGCPSDQRLEHAPVDPLQIDAPAQIRQTLNGPRASRSSMIASTAEAPTPLMAPMP